MRKIGDYEIVSEIGKGAFGRVFLAKKDGKEYALKETISSGRKATKAAQRESKLMVSLDHINIVKLYEYFTFGHPAKCFMIMELLIGRELFSIICDENEFDNLTESILKFFIRQIALGLEYLHSKNIIHMDLKPENLIAINKDDKFTEIKIVDFGLAEDISTNPDLCSLNGTDGYKSPEQINFEPISDKSDMWALGCIT